MLKKGKELLLWTITGSVSLGVAIAVPTFSILHFNRDNNYNPEQLWYANDLVDENNSQLYFHSKQEINFYVNKHASLESASTYQYNNFQIDRDLHKIIVYTEENDLKNDIFADARDARSNLLSSHQKVAEGNVQEGSPVDYYEYHTKGLKKIYQTSKVDSNNNILYSDDQITAVNSFLQDSQGKNFFIQPPSFLNALLSKYTGSDYSSIFTNATHAKIGRTDGNALIKYWDNGRNYYEDAVDILLNTKKNNTNDRFTFAVDRKLAEFPQDAQKTDDTYSLITTRGAKEDYRYFYKNSSPNNEGFYDVNKLKSKATATTYKDYFENNDCAFAYAPSDLQPRILGGSKPLYITQSGNGVTSNVFDAADSTQQTKVITYCGISDEERNKFFVDKNKTPLNTMVFANKDDFRKFLETDDYISFKLKSGTYFKKSTILDIDHDTVYISSSDLPSDASSALARQYAKDDIISKWVNFSAPDQGEWNDPSLTASTNVYELNGKAYKTEDEFLEAYYQFEKNRPNSPIIFEQKEFFRVGHIKAVGTREDLIKAVGDDVKTINTKDIPQTQSFHIYKPGD